MIKKITKEIQRIQQQKSKLQEKKEQTELEISELNANLKDLNQLKNQYEKLAFGTDEVLSKLSKE